MSSPQMLLAGIMFVFFSMVISVLAASV